MSGAPRILILGGTAWLGGEVARQAVVAGLEVTCLARGESGSVPAGATSVRADRTEPGAYREVSDGHWDLVVDVSRQPGQVRTAVSVLAERAEHWVFVSTGSVYADHSAAGAGPDAPLLPALDADVASVEDYGPGKVTCERLCREARGDDLLVARSGLIAGRGDPSDRFGYWPGRFALAAQDGGPVLVPARLDRPAQLVDVVDLAGWVLSAGLGGTTGTVDAYGPRRVLREVIARAQEVAGFSGEVVALSDDELLATGIDEYMGPRSLPLWLQDPAWAGFSDRSTQSAEAAGLASRDLGATLHDALDWERELGLARTGRRAGLDRSDELALIDASSDHRA